MACPGVCSRDPTGQVALGAAAGSIVIVARTHELVRDQAEVRALGAVDLKGKSAPTPVYELVGLRAKPAERLDERKWSIQAIQP